MPTDSPLIGYGAFHIEDEVYGDCDDWTFVADSPESLAAFLTRGGCAADEYRAEEVRLADILAGRGDSVGMLCLEPEARKRFVAAAEAAGVKYDIEELDDGLASVEIPNSAMSDITHIPAVKPLLDHLYYEELPAEEIERLAATIRADPDLAGRCLALFDAEVGLRREAHGALLVWLGFALALAGDGKSLVRFAEVVRAYGQDDGEVLPGHYRTGLGCLALSDESVREAAGRLPFSDAALLKPFTIWNDLELLTAVGRSGDELLRKRVAAEAERLLEHPVVPDEYVEPACRALAAADPKRALDVVPGHLERCESPSDLKRILKAIRKHGSAEGLLSPPWPVRAESAADCLLDDLDAEEFDEDEDGDDDFEDVEEGEAAGRMEAIVSEMQREGIDPTDPASVERWLRDFNARPLAERARLLPGPGVFSIPPELVDECGWELAPEPAPKKPEPPPYEPCPCGSGRKYKWCCREKDRKTRG